MKVISSTDRKYLGSDLPDDLKVGDLVSLADFTFVVQFVRRLDDGRICVGSPNYQLICEE
jgi:hypothetical protein